MRILPFLLIWMALLLAVSLQAQPPTDHPPVPQIDRTDNIKPAPPATVKAAPLNIDFSGKQYYRLVSIKAVDINGMHTAAEMEAFQKEAIREFEKTAIAIDWAKGLWYTQSKKDKSAERQQAFTQNGKTLAWVNCQKCQDGQYSIVKHSGTSLILQVNAQDESQHIVYQFEFVK